MPGIPDHLNPPDLQALEAAVKAKGLCGARYRRTMYEAPWSRVCTKRAHAGNRHSDAAPKAEPTEPAGTCQICFRQQQTRAGNLVLHGYKRPGWGYTVGKCWGCDYAPFEVSCERTKQFIQEVLKVHLARCEARLVELQARPESLPYQTRIFLGSGKPGADKRGYVGVTVQVVRDAPMAWTKTEVVATKRSHYAAGPVVEVGDFEQVCHPSYEQLLADLVARKESDIRMVKEDIASYEKRIEDWLPAPWPVVKA